MVRRPQDPKKSIHFFSNRAKTRSQTAAPPSELISLARARRREGEGGGRDGGRDGGRGGRDGREQGAADNTSGGISPTCVCVPGLATCLSCACVCARRGPRATHVCAHHRVFEREREGGMGKIPATKTLRRGAPRGWARRHRHECEFYRSWWPSRWAFACWL